LRVTLKQLIVTRYNSFARHTESLELLLRAERKAECQHGFVKAFNRFYYEAREKLRIGVAPRILLRLPLKTLFRTLLIFKKAPEPGLF